VAVSDPNQGIWAPSSKEKDKTKLLLLFRLRDALRQSEISSDIVRNDSIALNHDSLDRSKTDAEPI